MSVTAPPRPPQRGQPLDREEIEALIEALIEEARQRARHRRRKYLAVMASAVVVGVAVFVVLQRTALSPEASPGLFARSSLSAEATGSKIAFMSSRPINALRFDELYVVNADGSGKRLVTRVRSDGFLTPAWSPDGRQIAFNGVRAGAVDIYVVNADGSGRRNLTHSAANEGSPVWSPDGRKIAFLRPYGPGDVADIYVMNADGSGQRNLTRNAAFDSSPVWSSDGGKIAFVRFRPSRKNSDVWKSAEVWLMNADGTEQRSLARGWPSAWSPDGQKIAFMRPQRRKSEIYVMNADGSSQRRLTRNAVLDEGPTWSPDGQKIAFTRGRGDSWDIYVMNADGTAERRLTRRGSGPHWSPEGQVISFVTARDGNFEIYVMNADGSGQRNLTQTPRRAELGHAWSPVQKK